MDALMSFVETAGIAMVGILIRFLIAAAGLILLSLALAAVFMGWEGVRTLVERARGIVHAGALVWRRGFYYSPSHTWLAALGDGSLRIGLDDLAQKILPGARVLQFAPVDVAVRRGDPIALLAVGDHRFSIGAPTAGRVLAINDRLGHNPDLLHRDPYGRGWLAKIRPDGREYRDFPTGERAQAWIRREDHRLNAFLESKLGIAAADGGEWIVAPTTMLSDQQFDALTREFLTPP
jgi:glycine cleavage system H protein